MSNFRNEIIWNTHQLCCKGKPAQTQVLWGANTDTILFYTKERIIFELNPFADPFTDPEEIIPQVSIRQTKTGSEDILTTSSSSVLFKVHGRSDRIFAYEWKGFRNKNSVRLAPYPRKGLKRNIAKGNIVIEERPHRKTQLLERLVRGRAYWAIYGRSREVADRQVRVKRKSRLSHPEASLPLLERIIRASSKEGGMVLDPFCGCATSCVAAEKLSRQMDWDRRFCKSI